MKKLLIPLVLALSSVGTLSYAATVDLTTLTFSANATADDSVTPNFATLADDVTLSGTVVDVTSFDYLYTSAAAAKGTFSVTAGPTLLLEQNSVTNGWQTYTFASAYSGPLSFNLAISVNTAVQIENLTTTVAPVPEPETYALLCAGLGLIAGMTWLKKQSSSYSNKDCLPAS